MSILQEILTWSEGLPAWQSDAIARLFAKGAIPDDDLDDLFALLKAEHGIPDPQRRTAKKLSVDQIPAATGESGTLSGFLPRKAAPIGNLCAYGCTQSRTTKTARATMLIAPNRK